MSVEAVVELGIKGQDIVTSTFKKLAKEKQEFEKKSTTQVGSKGRAQRQGKTGKDQEEQSDSERRNEKEKVSYAEKSSKAAKVVAGSMETAARGMASLNPTEFIRSAAAATVQLTSNVAGGAANAAWTGSGQVVKAIIDHAGKLVDMGIQAASGALSAYKSALPIQLKRQAETSIINFTGAQGINNETMTRSESAQMASALLPVVGKIGKEFNVQLKRLYDPNKKGNIVNRAQANSLAQGDFSSLGNSKGWLLNQISQSTGNMPPEMVQKFRSGLLSQVSRSELGSEHAGTRIANQQMNTSDLAAQGAIVSAGKANKTAMLSANNSLNKLQVNMINSVSGLSTVLDNAASSLTSLLNNLAGDIRTTKAKAADERRRGRQK